LANHAHEGREEPADGHHARARDLAAQLAAEALDAAGVLAHDADQAAELALDLGEVARDLADPAGQEVEIVVAIELELLEDLTERHVGYRVPARRAGLGVRQRTMRVLGLELGDGLGQTGLRERQELARLLELHQVAIETAPGDDELAHEIHQRVETVEAHADARTGAPGDRLAGRPGRGGCARRDHRLPRRATGRGGPAARPSPPAADPGPRA